MNYIDWHCDTLSMFRNEPADGDSLWSNRGSVDFERMVRAGCAAQFFAIFFPPPEQMDTDDISYFRRLYLPFRRALAQHGDCIALTRNYAEYRSHRRKGLISAFLTLEDGRLLNGSHETLDILYYLGVRLITLTWNGANCLGWPNSDDPAVMERGLTEFGREAVEHMNRLGMLIDVSHLSDGGFWSVASLSAKPFVASHSNARALAPHRRNLTDAMIRAIAEKGGIIGVNYYPPFLSPDPRNTRSTVAMICDHIRHLYCTGGLGCVALGSDWDGISGLLDIPDPTALPLLFDELQKRGFPSSAIEKIAFRNAERVLRDCL